MKRWLLPSSPSAWRADFTRLATAASVTTRPSQTFSMISSRETSALPVLDEQREQGEHLRLERLHGPAQAQFDLGEVELELGKPVNHGREHRSAPGPARGKPP